MAAPAPASLPRDLLRWIQSLDLSYSVKNAKRDFANGFLVAEVFSRYYEQDIHMHSFSNGNSLDNRRDNWGLLMKFFKKKGVQPGGADITQEEMNDIMQAKAGAINSFLAKVYSFLTGKKVHAPTLRSSDEALPAFAKSTAAHAIRETMRDPGIEAIQDIATKEAKMREALQQHQVAMAEEKAKDPSRYAPSKRGAKVVRGATRTVGVEDSVGSVEIKQVAVKSVETSVANLRAAKELQASRSTLSLGGPFGGAPDFDASGLTPVLEVLNGAVRAAWAENRIAEPLDPAMGPALSFVEKLVSSSPALPPATSSLILTSLSKFATVAACGDAGLASPREYYQLFTLWQPVLAAVPESSPVFAGALDFLVAVGKHMAGKDASLTSRLFRDFALPSLCPIILSRPSKRHAALRLLYAHAEGSAVGHLAAIKTLQQALNNLPVFSHMLSILVFIEDAFNDDLVDLYLYYCLIGLRASSPSLRAACLAMLSVIASHNPDVAVGAVDQVLSLGDDTWWEVKAQLIIVSASMLDSLDPERDSAVCSLLLACICKQLDTANSPAVLRVGVGHLAKTLTRFPSLGQEYVGALLAIPADARARLMDPAGPKDELPLSGISGGKYRLPCAVAEWPADVVLTSLVKLVQRERLEHLEVAHYEVLLGVMAPPVPDTVLTSSFEALQSHIFVGMVDSDCSAAAIQLLTSLAYGPLGARVFNSPALQGSLVLLHRFPGGTPDPECQANVAKFLSDVAATSSVLKSAIAAVLGLFKANNAELLKASPLAPVARSLGV